MALANSYLDVSEFRERTTAPESLVDGAHIPEIDTARRASWRVFVERQLAIETGRINGILRKRYAVPFSAPVPEVVCGWLVSLVTPKLYERRGWDPSDAHATSLLEQAKSVVDELKEAADSQAGLYDLPLRQDSTQSGIEKGGPMAYSEASPYAWTDVQAEEVRRR